MIPSANPGTSPINTNSEPPQARVETKRAADPFDRDDADFILRSSDGVDFYVHRMILSLASPWFASMFTLPQPPGESAERPVVDVEEDSETMDIFLRICYPLPDPRFMTFPTIPRVIAAAVKYDAPAVLSSAKDALVRPQILASDPLRAFAIACSFGLEEEAEIAAEKAVVDNRVIGQTCPELDKISAAAYYHLLQLCGTRKVAKSTFDPAVRLAAVNFTDVGPFCEPPTRKDAPTANPIEPEYPFNGADADLILRSSDSVDFRVSASILMLASPKILALPVTNDSEIGPGRSEGDASDRPNPEVPVRCLAEDSVTLNALLRLCYPAGHLPVNPDAVLGVLEAARKYEALKAEQSIRDLWPTLVRRAPLRLYFAAAQNGWRAEAMLCARELLLQYRVSAIPRQYFLEMYNISNCPYRRLLTYIEECSRVATEEHKLSLPGKLRRTCTHASQCNAAYPCSFSTGTTCPTLVSFSWKKFHEILKDNPWGSAINATTEIAQSFMSAAVSSHLYCSKTSSGAEFGGRQCRPSDNLAWAVAAIGAYSKAVDSAVSKVKLQIGEGPSTS